MTLLGKLFRPWDLSNEDQQLVVKELKQKQKSTNYSEFPVQLSPLQSVSEKKQEGESVVVNHNEVKREHKTTMKRKLNFTSCKHQSTKESYNKASTSNNNNKGSFKKCAHNGNSNSNQQNKKAITQVKASASNSSSEHAKYSQERDEGDHSSISQEMYLDHTKLPCYSESTSPANFDVYYGHSPNIFLYPNPNTINELASLSRLELTAMGLLPPEPASTIKIRRQRPKRFHCPHCQVAFSNNGQLRGHIRIHTGERPFVCEEEGCGKSFTRNEELTRHRRIHSGLRPFPCSYCGKKFGRKDHLKKHTRTHQRGVYNARTASLIGYGNPFQPFHHNLLSSTSFATPNELITLQSQYSSFSQQQPQQLPLFPLTTTGTAAAASVSSLQSQSLPFIQSSSANPVSVTNPNCNGYL